MNNFERRLLSFPTCAQKFILDPCVNNLSYIIFDVNSRCTYDDYTVLMFLCMYSHSFDPFRYSYYIPHATEKIKWLLTVGGADPNIQIENGETALMIAAHFSSPRRLSKRQCMVETLKSYNIDPINQRINKKLSFMIASHLQKKENFIEPKSSEDIVYMLLTAGADPNKQDIFKQSVLIYAIRFSSPKRGYSSERTVKMLLDKGVDPNKQNTYGYTALMIAAGHSSPERGESSEKTVNILLSKGADPNIQDENGYTALMHAARHSSPERGESSEKTVEILRNAITTKIKS